AAFGAFVNSGQICMSTERIIVDKRVADGFVEKLVAKVRALPVGDPRQGRVVLGSLVDMAAADRCNAMIADALGKGASLLCGGPSEGTVMPATLLDHVTPEMRVYREEVFGPVRG